MSLGGHFGALRAPPGSTWPKQGPSGTPTAKIFRATGDPKMNIFRSKINKFSPMWKDLPSRSKNGVFVWRGEG